MMSSRHQVANEIKYAPLCPHLKLSETKRYQTRQNSVSVKACDLKTSLVLWNGVECPQKFGQTAD